MSSGAGQGTANISLRDYGVLIARIHAGAQ
jgi:hypothetical protein